MSRESIIRAINTALIADSYALGAHWIYDGKELAALSIDWDDLNAPQAHWHKGKQKGDFTHYGDHGKWLLEFVSNTNNFDIDQYRDFWVEKMKNYDGYVDASSRETLKLVSTEPLLRTGSSSTDLSIIGRISPLLLISNSPETFLTQVQDFVAFTHNSTQVLEGARFFARVLLNIVDGAEVKDALFSVEVSEHIADEFDAGIRSEGKDSFRTIRAFGPACGFNGGFEGTLHLLTTYDGFQEAMTANVKAGGDSAARGMIIGMLMGAAGKPVPASWEKQTKNLPQAINNDRLTMI